MRVSDFDYQLPPERIAQRALEPRDSARLLCWERELERLEHRHVRDLPDCLRAGDLLVINDTKVIPARLRARRASGARVEFLFLEELEGRTWRALARPAKKLREAELLTVGGGLELLALRRELEGPAGSWLVQLRDPQDSSRAVLDLLDSVGELPLPPYIQRAESDPRSSSDRERYQTIYAREAGAVAAPTAGLHFTPQLLGRLAEAEIELARVTLHVGLGTFRPIAVEDTREHRMHKEAWRLDERAVAAVEACRARGGRVIAVGTTSVRVLESCAEPDGRLRAGSGQTDLFIEPGYRWRVIDGLLTNFHLPRSTLLMLVSALTGRERLLALYAEAIRREYRFYSFGDAMLIL